MERLDQAFEAVRTFKPMSEPQLQAILSKTREAAMTGGPACVEGADYELSGFVIVIGVELVEVEAVLSRERPHEERDDEDAC